MDLTTLINILSTLAHRNVVRGIFSNLDFSRSCIINKAKRRLPIYQYRINLYSNINIAVIELPEKRYALNYIKKVLNLLDKILFGTSKFYR